MARTCSWRCIVATSRIIGVSSGSPMIWSGEPGLLGLRRQLEQAFLTALRADVRGGTDVAAEIDTLLIGVRPECARKGPRLFQWFL
jgi:hypothetical protein